MKRGGREDGLVELQRGRERERKRKREGEEQCELDGKHEDKHSGSSGFF